MKQFRDYVAGAFVSGLLVVIPAYLGVLLLLKVVDSLRGLVSPVAALLPEWLPRESLVALILVLLTCLAVGILLRTTPGRAVADRLHQSILGKIPGYLLFRGLTEQFVGKGEENNWKPALVEIEEALVPGFIIEEIGDGRYTVFVPSVPTAFTGSVYILTPDRVHPVSASMFQTFKTLSRWGAGSKELVAAMETKHPVR